MKKRKFKAGDIVQFSRLCAYEGLVGKRGMVVSDDFGTLWPYQVMHNGHSWPCDEKELEHPSAAWGQEKI